MAHKTRIGIFSFAHLHADSYASALVSSGEIEFVGIADPNVDRGQAKAQQFGTTYFPTTESLLEKQLDGAIICSENALHRSLVEASAHAGVKAIICEKPIATSREDAESMIACCAAHSAYLGIAFPCRFSPVFTQLRSLVQQNGLGDILAIRGTNRGRNPGGWFNDKALAGGGAVIDHTVHVADLNRLLLGKEATEVYAEIGNGFYKGDFDDTGFLTITYDDGVFATLDTSWSRPQTFPTWGDVTLQIVGTTGVVDVDLCAQAMTHYDDKNKAILSSGWGSNFDALMIAEFLRVVQGQPSQILATGEDGLRALDVALAAYKSAEVGQPVKVGG